MNEALLRLRQLKVHFPLRGAWPWQQGGKLKAVDGVDLDLYAGQTLGVVGESGCGKSTLARALTGLVPLTGGTVVFDGQDLSKAGPRAWRRLRRDVQLIFQDPLASLDPRMTVGQIIAEPLRYLRRDLSRAERWRRAVDMLERVGLSKSQINRYPHEFSGGQCQRIGIARALVVQPRVLICDEPVSALDVSIQAQIVALLAELQTEFNIAILFIAHDLAVVRQISQQVLVMYLGRVMETASADTLFDNPAHPYTRALLSAVPRPDPRSERLRQRIRLQGDLPSPASPPSGCVFRTRCPWAQSGCAQTVPVLAPACTGSHAACLYADEIVESDTVPA